MLNLVLGTVGLQDAAGKLLQGAWLNRDELRLPGLALIKKSRYVCSYCGYQSRGSDAVPHGYMTPIDPSRANWFFTESSVSGHVACPFCASCQCLNWSVKGMTTGIGQKEQTVVPGILISFPWLTQRQINWIALHSLSINSRKSNSSNGPIYAIARDVDAVMVALNHELVANLPIYRGKDSEFVRALSLLPNKYYKYREKIIGDVRWWPNLAFWQKEGLYFQAATYRGLEEKHATELGRT